MVVSWIIARLLEVVRLVSGMGKNATGSLHLREWQPVPQLNPHPHSNAPQRLDNYDPSGDFLVKICVITIAEMESSSLLNTR